MKALENALAKKPLQLVRRQAHLSDEGASRYTPVGVIGRGGGGEEEEDDEYFDPNGRTGEQRREAPLRHMNLFDLVAFGVGCTVGSGVFVLAGMAASEYAGPASSVSYLLAGLVASLSGLPYAELSAAFPLDGSTYSYAYIALGEVFAVVSSLCQTLEYGAAGAAVARSWGNKFVDWVGSGDDTTAVGRFLNPGGGVNPMAGVIALVCSLILLLGVRESKAATNVVSTTKVLLIMFMTVSGFLLASGVVPKAEDGPATFDNWSPFFPDEFRPQGIVDGASILFFAYLGFDCICNLSGEAKDPVRDVPRAVILTLAIDGAVYFLAALALTAMQSYSDISAVSGFSRAFGANGWAWAEALCLAGEIVVLPLVVLTSIQSQTRLFFAMSKDRLVPAFFGKLSFSRPCCGGSREDKDGSSKKADAHAVGNLTRNTQFCGLATVLLATFVPFRYIESLISAGALLLFSITCCCLLTVRYKCPSETYLGLDIDDNASFLSLAVARSRKELSLGRILVLLNAFSISSGLCFGYVKNSAASYSLSAVFFVLAFMVAHYMSHFEEASATRFALDRNGYLDRGRRRFRTPLVPYLPSMAIYANGFMIAHVGWQGLAMLAAYLSVGVAGYLLFGSGRSLVASPPDESHHEDGRIASSLQEAFLEDGEEGREGGESSNIDRGKSEIEKTILNKERRIV